MVISIQATKFRLRQQYQLKPIWPNLLLTKVMVYNHTKPESPLICYDYCEIIVMIITGCAAHVWADICLHDWRHWYSSVVAAVVIPSQ
jgi:hypothetical protein